ncbi:sensor histidine kinase [Pedobacter cryoconitis]|uniref:histidine kinase n=1 Tax=Pedobacter cryoconitis TaxID=188932 RepID=A0A7X0MGR0_9SPHI|nr:HAMP domain-containing sensor histidine kinase [Pedobacter cryoconitis]MBB6498334.1 two-component system phosphate regulon sensor histidine kinase PhoR [Pedobacter cryoconitis]
MKKKLRFIIGIMGLSLIGIFLLQAFWLNNSYKISMDQFKRDIATVLEQNSNAVVFNEAIQHGIYGDSSKVYTSGMIAKLSRLLLSMSDEQGKKHKTGLTITLAMTDSSTTKDTKDSLNKKSGTKDSKSKLFTVNTDSTYIAATLKSQVPSLRHRLDSLFKTKGISSRYALKLSNSNKKGGIYIDQPQLFKQIKAKEVPIRVGLMTPYVMQLAIESDNQYYFRKMQWILLASTLILIMVSCSFIYMLRTIFQQKKVAEIKSDFINNMTHEFKTPITTVALGIEAMKNFDVLRKPELAAEYLDICESEIKRVAEMVEKVLKLAAFERSEVSLNLQQINVVALIEEVINNMQLMLKNKGAKLVFNSAEPDYSIKADKTHLSGVIYNLIDNSIKYAGEHPLIEISCRKEETAFIIEFGDHGVGIPKQYQNKIFEKFFRVPTGDLAKVSGFGLGLSYVATIIQMHNGSITLNNTPDQGTHFTIKLLQ